jgi:hypothetical protein
LLQTLGENRLENVFQSFSVISGSGAEGLYGGAFGS